MLRRLRHSLVVLLALALGGAAARADERFPTAPGTYWVYRGTTQWTVPGTASVEKRELTWRVEVVDQRRGDGFEVAFLRGFPSELAAYEPGNRPGEFALVILDGAAYYLIEGAAAVAAARSAAGTPVVGAEELLFRWPLHQGDRFGDPASVARPDGMYCRVVDAASRSRSSGIERYRLTQRTLPDREVLDFVPGLGVVGFAYTHHGTVSPTHLRVIEFGRP